MAALMRMSRLVNSSVIRRVLHQSVQSTPKLTTVKYLTVKTAQFGREVPGFIARHLSVAQPFSASQDSEFRRSSNFDRDNQLNELYQELDFQWKRYNKISKEQIYAALIHSEKEGYLKTTEAFLLLRLCGECLVRHNAEERQQIFKDVLERVEKIVVDPDIAYYNVILRARLENRDYFNPAEALADIEAQPSMSANRMTYQLMVDSYCLQGDLTGATTILEHIKSRNMPINEQIFNSLVTGYMRSGDTEGARSVLGMMGESGLLSTRDVYTNLMCGFAEQGNLVEIQKVRAEAEEEGIPLGHRYLFRAIVALGEFGHEAAFTELIHEVAEKFGTYKFYNTYAMTAAFKLAAAGKPDEAIEIYKTMTVFPQDGFKDRSSSKLMEAFIVQDQPNEVIFESMNKLEKAGYNLDKQYVIYMAIKHNKDVLADMLYEDFIKQGERIQQGTVNSILRIREVNKDVDGILELIRNHWDFMLRLSVNDLVSRTHQAFQEMGLSPEDVHARMKEKGFSPDIIQQYRVLQLILDGEFDEAEKCLEEFDKRAFIPITLKVMTNSINKVDPDRFIQFLFLFEERLDSSSLFRSIAISSLHRLIQLQSVTGEKAVQYVEYFADKGIKADSGLLSRIRGVLAKKNIEQNIIENLTTKLVQDETTSTDAKTWSPEKEREMCVKFERNPDSIPHYLHNKVSLLLLRKYMDTGDIEKAEPLLTKLKGVGFHFRGRDLMRLFFYNMDSKNDLNSALECRERILEERGEQPSTVSLALANNFIMNNNPSGAIDELKKTMVTEDNRTFHKYKISDMVSLAQEKCPEKVVDLQNVLFEQNYTRKGSDEILHPTMQQSLDSKDPDRILATCEAMNKELGKIPLFPEVLKFYVGLEDPDRLQRVVDMLSHWRGEGEILHHLVIAFIACNKVRQAQRITEDPGFKANSGLILRLQRYFDADMKPELLEKYVEVLKDATQNDRDHLLFWLIKQHAVFKQPKQALDVLAKYEEEGILPRGRTLRYLASVLNSHHMEVPFQVPQRATIQAENVQPESIVQVMQESTPNVLRTPKAPKISPVVPGFETVDPETSPADFIAGLQEKINEGSLPSDSLANSILQFNDQNNPLGRNILEYMTEQGQVEELSSMRPQLSKVSRLTSLFHGYLFKAYANCDKGDEFLQHLNDDFEGYKPCLNIATLHHIGSKHPELFEKLVSMIHQKKTDMPDQYRMLNLLFGAYCQLHKFQEAEGLLEKYPDLKQGNRLMLREWIPRGPNFYSENPDEMLRSVVDMLGDSVPGRVACTRWLSHNVQKNDLQGILDVLDYVKNKDMKYTILGHDALSRAQNILKENNTTVPWTPEELAVTHLKTTA